MSVKIGKINLDNYLPLRDVVFQALRESIIRGDLKPGERLMEIQLSEKLGVSRTPVREAIRKLELEGFVVMLARKGAHVAELSIKDIKDVLEVRGCLDSLATELAAKKIKDDELKQLKQTYNQFVSYVEKNNVQGAIKKDTEFHEIIYKASRNEKLIQIANNLREQVHRFRVIYIQDNSHSEDLIKEHGDILKALEEKKSEQASVLAGIHIKNQADGIIATVEKKM